MSVKEEPKVKCEKSSETESEEEFYDIENKDVKKEILVESKMASENKGFTLQVFDGIHYDKWKYKLKLFLETNDCSEVIENDARPTTITEVEWKTKEIKAKNYIVSSTTNTQLELIISEETAKKMVAKLDENYLGKSSAVKLLCKRKLLGLKMDKSENPTDFYNNFEKLVNELKNAGENVTKEDKLNYFLLTLPESMSHMVDIVDALAEKDKTVEFVKSKLEFEFKKRHGESENSRSNAFTFEKNKHQENRTCYVCGGVGHIQYDCPTKNNSGNRTPQ